MLPKSFLWSFYFLSHHSCFIFLIILFLVFVFKKNSCSACCRDFVGVAVGVANLVLLFCGFFQASITGALALRPLTNMLPPWGFQPRASRTQRCGVFYCYQFLSKDFSSVCFIKSWRIACANIELLRLSIILLYSVLFQLLICKTKIKQSLIEEKQNFKSKNY